jgi:D-alanyl-lipoteichoic acid acyltransferase DltB (MBOAT superfamily)
VFGVNLFIDFINLCGGNLAEFTFSLILPVGISFYTFQTLSYVIDVYRGSIKAERHLGYYALFVVYFPQLVAGPIERPENLIPQLREEHKFNADDFCTGLRIAVVGFFKKVVIADGVAVFVNAVYNNVSEATAVSVIIATVLFAVQIYCDFSGYTDIAIGVARMMGIKLRDNFNQPYLALNIKDFWRRWHISLTSWFTDYVYKPLGGSRCKLWRWAINVMIVFLLSGLWHGASLTFVVWGGIHGVYQIIGKLKNIGIGKLENKYNFTIPDNVAVRTIKRIITFALVCFAWIFFRGNSLNDCGVLIGKIFTDWSSPLSSMVKMGLTAQYVLEIMLMFATLAMMNTIIKFNPEKPALLGGAAVSRKVTYVYLILAVAMAWIGLTLSGTESVFIYFQF